MELSSNTEVHLPRGWVQARLMDVAEIVLGQSPPSSTYNENGQGLPFYQGKLEFGNVYPIPKKWCTSPKKIAERGDVLISVRAPVGPTNICPEKSCIGRGLAAMRGLNGIETYFMLYLLRAFEDSLAGKGTGTTFNAITGDKLKEFIIPFPPLLEQQRIVSKIEELFSDLDAGVAELKKSQVLLKRYRQSVLKSAVEGKLTADWREKHRNELEPASVLLEKIRVERKVKQGKKYKEPKAIETTELAELPEKWAWTKLENVLEDIDKINPKKTPEKEFIYLDIAAIDNKIQKIVSPKKYLGKNAPSRARQLVKTGDILFSTVRTYLRNIAMVGETFDGQIASTGFCVIRPTDHLSNTFFFYLVRTEAFLNPLNELQRGTNYPAVRNPDVYEQLIALPPLLEQRRIVEEVERRFSVIDAAEKSVDENLKLAERLRQSILKQAFEGKLVPQDPRDEPASVLLERIRKEKGELKGRKSNKQTRLKKDG